MTDSGNRYVPGRYGCGNRWYSTVQLHEQQTYLLRRQDGNNGMTADGPISKQETHADLG